MSRSKSGSIFTAIFLSFGLSTSADASFLGNTITAEWFVEFPDVLVTVESHEVLVTESVELPPNEIMGDSRFSIDIGDNYVLFSFSEATTWGDEIFNGWKFSDTDGVIDEIVGYTIGATTGIVTGLEDIDLSFTGDSVQANFGRSGNNVSVSAGSTIRLDVHFSPIPIPPAVWLLGSGIIGLIGIAGRKKA